MKQGIFALAFEYQANDDIILSKNTYLHFLLILFQNYTPRTTINNQSSLNTPHTPYTYIITHSFFVYCTLTWPYINIQSITKSLY